MDTDICDSSSDKDYEDSGNIKKIEKRQNRSVKIFEKKMKSAEELIPESL